MYTVMMTLYSHGVHVRRTRGVSSCPGTEDRVSWSPLLHLIDMTVPPIRVRVRLKTMFTTVVIHVPGSNVPRLKEALILWMVFIRGSRHLELVVWADLFLARCVDAVSAARFFFT